MTLVLTLSVGCAGGGRVEVAEGTTLPGSVVLRGAIDEHGLPDVIGERAGDEGRFYPPSQYPWLHEWPRATVSYYYVDEEIVVVREPGEEEWARSMTANERESIRSIR